MKFEKITHLIDRVQQLYANVVASVMDSVFETYLGVQDGSIEPDDIPKTNEPVWILAKKYNAIQGFVYTFSIKNRKSLFMCISCALFGQNT